MCQWNKLDERDYATMGEPIVQVSNFVGPVQFSIDNCTLLIQGISNLYSPPNPGKLACYSERSFKISIPIYSVVADKSGQFISGSQILTSFAAIKIEWGVEKLTIPNQNGGAIEIKEDQVHENNTGGYIQNRDNINMNFNFSLEENLVNRINKAFSNLKSYCAKPSSNEPF